MTKFLKTFLFTLIICVAPMVLACDGDDDWDDVPGDLSGKDSTTQKLYGDFTTSDRMKGLTTSIGDTAYVDTNNARGQSSNGTTTSKSGQNQGYLNNLDSVMENRNKLRLNAASRAIALGQHAVALATDSGDDVNALQAEIETQDDMLRMLKGIAKLQAQTLQKTNAITAMRAKIAELNAIDHVIHGSIYTTQPASSKNSK